MAVERAGGVAARRRVLGVIPVPRHVSLSVTLATAIGGLLFIAVLLVLGLSITANRKNTLSLLADKAELLLELAETRLRDHLDPAEDQVTHIARLIRDQTLDPTNRKGLETAMIASMGAAPQVLAMVFWDGGDVRIGVARFPSGRVERIPQPLQSPEERAEIAASLEGQTVAFWGRVIYLDERQGSALNLRFPLRPPGRPVGGIAAIVSTAELSRFLTELDGGVDEAVPFILYGDDQVLAHPNMAFGFAGLSDEKRLPTLYDIGDPLLAALWTRGEPTPLEGRDNVRATYIELGNDEQVALYRRIEGYGSRPLVLGIRFPEASVDEELERMARSALAGLFLLVLAVSAGIVMGKRIARPVIRLADRASRIAGLEFARTEPLPGSVFTEIDNQASAFNRMLAGLKWFETYVPRSLVRRLMAQQLDEDMPSEERELTVLFTDIGGFTSASEGMPAPATADFLNRHFALLAACIEAEGGTIDKFIGDSVMAFWGAPEDQPDHADRACRAALAMAEAIRDYNAGRAAAGEPGLALRIGIHTGAMVVGNIGAPGRMNYTIVGDAVNTGNRLEQLGKQLGDAREVTILISGATKDRLGGGFAPEFCGRQAVRGRQQGIEVYRLA